MTASRPGPDARPVSPEGSPFVERVMARVASSPAPSLPRSFMAAVRERSPREVRASLAVAWHIALHSRVPALVRVQALGLVAVIALSVGAVSVTASAAAYRIAVPLVVDVIAPDAPDARSVPAATPAPVTSPRVDASPAVDPSPQADASGDDGDSGRAAVHPGDTHTPQDEARGADDNAEEDEGDEVDEDFAAEDIAAEEGEEFADEEDGDEAERDDLDAADADDTDEAGATDTDDGTGPPDRGGAPYEEDDADASDTDAGDPHAGDPDDPSGD